MKISYLFATDKESKIVTNCEVLLTTEQGNVIIDVDGEETLVLKKYLLSSDLIKEYADINKKAVERQEELNELYERLEEIRNKIFHGYNLG